MFKKWFGKSTNKQKYEVSDFSKTSNTSKTIKYRDFKNPGKEVQETPYNPSVESPQSVQKVTNWMTNSSISTLQEATQIPPDYNTMRPPRRLKKQMSQVPLVVEEQKNLGEEKIKNIEIIRETHALLAAPDPIVYTVPFTQKTSGKLEGAELVSPSSEFEGASYAL